MRSWYLVRVCLEQNRDTRPSSALSNTKDALIFYLIIIQGFLCFRFFSFCFFVNSLCQLSQARMCKFVAVTLSCKKYANYRAHIPTRAHHNKNHTVRIRPPFNEARSGTNALTPLHQLFSVQCSSHINSIHDQRSQLIFAVATKR